MTPKQIDTKANRELEPEAKESLERYCDLKQQLRRPLWL